jgi:O-acetyl-ADP-ribose deacetylase
MIELVQGSIIAQQDMVAVALAANKHLIRGGGVSGLMHRAAGPELEAYCKTLGPIGVGEAVISPGFGLPNRYVVHCVGPRYFVDQPEDVLLSNCYANALHLCEHHEIESIAFPAISTGIYNYPMVEAAEVSLYAVRAFLRKAKYVQQVRFVLYRPEDLAIWQHAYMQMGLG